MKRIQQFSTKVLKLNFKQWNLLTIGIKHWISIFLFGCFQYENIYIGQITL